MPPCPATAHWWQTQVPGLLVCWQLWLGAYSVGFFFFPFQLCCPLRFQNTPQIRLWEASYCVETSPPSWLRPQDRSPSLTLLSLFLSFIFVLPPFEENGLTFWVPGILHQSSEIVLWKLLSIQMIFWCTCGGESGLPSYFSTIFGLPSSLTVHIVFHECQFV